MLRSVLSALPAHTKTVVDLGAGGGGASEWLRRETGAAVYAVEPAHQALLAARSTFPELRLIEGCADRVPLRGGIADAVTMCGVLSLIAELDAVVEEVLRLLRSDGVFAVADLFVNGHRTAVSGRNVFRSLESMRDCLAAHGLTVVEVGCGATSPEPAWAHVSEQVDAWIEQHCSELPGYAEWKNDRQHLEEHIEAGDVIGGCLVASLAPNADRTVDETLFEGGRN